MTKERHGGDSKADQTECLIHKVNMILLMMMIMMMMLEVVMVVVNYQKVF